MAPESATSLAQLLLKRREYVQAFDHFPASKRTLVERLDVPRSTLDNVIRELEAQDLVTYQDGRWEVTNLGRYARDVQKRYFVQLDSLGEAAEIVNELPSDCPLDARVVVGADTYESDPKILDSSIHSVLGHVRSASTVRVVAPKTFGACAIPFYENVSVGEAYSLEVIASGAIIDHFREEHAAFAAQLCRDDNTTVYRSSVPFDIFLWVVPNDHVGVIAFTEWGVRGGLINESERALEWGIDQYERVKRDAVPVENRVTG